ncbi:hypothetical protein K2173_009072 [Erythroxylum novogranatense]|uniref:Uncharacterized protein n=1 Tax=Erythroxylum novogranatense TaxID=1862640 RepID=A0AAV8TSQ9_9ROSI|nr:hypothetical protein K2173_009072 [Erythroxylum novogranatense]
MKLLILRFRFDNAWLQDANLEAVVVAGWRCEGKVDLLHTKANCVAELQLWGRHRNGDRHIKGALVQKLLQERRAGTDGGDLDRLRAEWNLLLEEDEVRRRQQTKFFWAQYGDMNSKYFHAHIKGRRKNNLITGLKNATGGWCRDRDGMHDLVFEYF